jgi:hypothetical protein
LLQSMFRFDMLDYRFVPDFNYSGLDAERIAILNQCQPELEAQSTQSPATPVHVSIRPIEAPRRYLANQALGCVLDKLPRVAFVSAALLANLAISEYNDTQVGPAISAAVSESGLADVDLRVGTSVAARNGAVDPVQLKMILDSPDTRSTVDDFESRAVEIVESASKSAKNSIGYGLKALASAAVGAGTVLVNMRRRTRSLAQNDPLDDSNTATYIGDESVLQKPALKDRLHFTPLTQAHISGIDRRDIFQVHEVTTSRRTRSIQRGLSLAALTAVTLTMVPKMLESGPVDSASNSIDGVTNQVVPTGKIETSVPRFITDPLTKRVTGQIIPVITADLPNITGALAAVDRSLVGYIEQQTEESGINTAHEHQVSLNAGVIGPTLEGVSGAIEHIGFDPAHDDFSPHDLAVPLALIASAAAYGSRRRPERFLVTQRLLNQELGKTRATTSH